MDQDRNAWEEEDRRHEERHTLTKQEQDVLSKKTTQEARELAKKLARESN